MRANEFLVEYKQEKTVEVFGRKLVNALLNDKGNMPAPALDRQISLLRSPDMKGIELDQQTISHVSNLILEFLKSADPTPHKQYTTWLAKVYSNQGIKLEDIISKGADWLATYQRMKNKKLLSPFDNDINRLTFGRLHNVVTDKMLLAKLDAVDQASMSKGNSEVILNTSAVRIIHPLDVAANKYYGQGTTWCTAATNNNMFDRYNSEGPMFILLPKQPKYDGEKYQIHAASGQFMNEEDEPVDPIDILTKRFGNLITNLRQFDPNFSKMIIFAYDNVLNRIIDEISEYASESADDRLTDWEVNDEYYYTWLQEEGFVDENGDVDYENAPGYLDYNDDAKREYELILDAINPGVDKLKEAAIIYMNDEEDVPMIKDTDDVIVHMMSSSHFYTRDEREILESTAEWIRRFLYVQDGKVIKK